MLASDVVDVVRSVAATDAATCDVAGLTTLAADVHRLRCWLDSVDAAVVARRRELATVGGRRSSREADVVVDRAVVCEAMPEVHAALASGALSAGHADAIARAANRLDDHERTSLPRGTDVGGRGGIDVGRDVQSQGPRPGPPDLPRRRPPAPREAAVATAVRRWRVGEGMCHTQISLDPEADARLSAVFDAAVAAETAKPDDGRTFDQLKADAFMTMVTAAPAPGAWRPAELLVLIDLETLRTGLHETSVCETFDGQPLPPDVVRRLACEANIIPIVLAAPAVWSTSAEPNGSPPRINDEPSARCTRPARRRTAPCASATATSTTSRNGRKAARRTWTT